MRPPEPTRPPLPERDEYGPGDASPGAPVDWSTAASWLEAARNYWLSTTRPDGRPHSVPMWAVWLDNALYFTTSPSTVSAKNIAENSDALAHPESGSEVVIVEGTAARLSPDDVSASVAEAYRVKYEWELDPADPGMPCFALFPRVVLAWSLPDVRGSAMRWRLS